MSPWATGRSGFWQSVQFTWTRPEVTASAAFPRLRGKANGQHAVQPQGGHRVADLLGFLLGRRQLSQGQRGRMEPHPSGVRPVRQQQLRRRGRGQYVGPAGKHQDIPKGLPGQAQGHETAQKVPVGQGVLLVKRGPDHPDGVLLRGLLPLRQEPQLPPLSAVVPAPEGVALRHGQGVQQPLGRRLLRRGQKARPLRQIPPPALFIFVPDPAQQQSLVPVCRQPVQHFPFIHGIPPDSGCDRVRHRPRLPPAAADGCPARRCGRPGSPGCGGRPGWWRAGGR